jgi:hypothetical protein
MQEPHRAALFLVRLGVKRGRKHEWVAESTLQTTLLPRLSGLGALIELRRRRLVHQIYVFVALGQISQTQIDRRVLLALAPGPSGRR